MHSIKNIKSVGHYKVYELYDANCDLLYIGSAMEPRARIKEHLRKQSWASEIEFFDISTGDLTRDEARRLEEGLIRTLKPKHNIIHSQY